MVWKPETKKVSIPCEMVGAKRGETIKCSICGHNTGVYVIRVGFTGNKFDICYKCVSDIDTATCYDTIFVGEMEELVNKYG